jgi:mRNA interferase MazF
MKRGEVWWVELDPVSDNEIVKTRPCLIVSPDDVSAALGTVMVAPLVSRGREARFRPAIALKDFNGLLLLDQIRAVEKARLTTRMGRIEDKSLHGALATLRAMFAE